MKIKEDMKSTLFREYDIRGVYPEEIDEDFAYTIGLSYGSYLQDKLGITNCITGYDNRLSSPILYSAMIKGVTDTGCDVLDIGLVTTPMNYEIRNKYKLPGIMITASHNPKDDNGFKFSFDHLANARGEMITNFRDYTLNKEFKYGNGHIENIQIVEDYIDKLHSLVKMGNRKLKVVIDAGNGTPSLFVKQIHDIYPFEFEYLYCDSDGNFPNHHPDPSVEGNLKDLKQKVLETQADLGISYDGDGDRIGIISDKGLFISADKLMIIYIRDLISKVGNKTFLYDVKCTKALEDDINKNGGHAYCYRTGASYTQAKTLEMNLMFGGEYSGHLYFNDRSYGNSCGIYAGLRLLEILSNTDKSITELLDNINTYLNYPEEKIHCDDNHKFDVVSKVKEYAIQKGYKINDIDGVRVNFDDGWALVRCSNTGPNITTRFEALNETRLNELRNEFRGIINANMPKEI